MAETDFNYEGIVFKDVLKPQYGFTLKRTIRDVVRHKLETEAGKTFSEEEFEKAYEGFDFIKFQVAGVEFSIHVQ